MPAELVDAMQAAGPAARDYRPGSRPILQLVRALCARRDLAQVEVRKPGFRLALARNSSSSLA
jgi:oxaloacetate decarboxylase alpha subunit